jgi:hypothetical protein
MVDIQIEVEQLLKAGVNLPSTSPYGASVLLIKKSDGSWRMCIDNKSIKCHY